MRFRDLFKPRPSVAEMTVPPEDTLPALAERALREGDFELALRSYDELIARDAGNAPSHYKRANALNRLGRPAEALAGYDRAIELDPNYAHAHCNRGTVLEGMGRWVEALAAYDRTLALDAGDSLAAYNRGSVLKELERFDDALESYERAITLNGAYVEAYVNRGHLLHRLGRYAQAIASYDAAIAIKPVYPAAFLGRGNSLAKLSHFAEAVASYTQALALEPEVKYLLGLHLSAKMQICDWQDFAPNLQRLTAGLRERQVVCAPFPALALVESPELQRVAAELYVREEHPPDDELGEIAPRPRREIIRIGYFSADFRRHVVSVLTAELFELHDRSRFEIIAFAFGPDADDPMRERVRAAFDRFIDVRKLSDSAVATLARELEIDIAVDLGGFTEHCRTSIFARRAAPIQASYLGFLGTMGAPYMDYLFADPVIIPAEARRYYAEKIAYLESYQVNDSKRTIADRVFTRAELGLPPTGFVFASFNANFKILPGVFASWARILRRVEGSVLFVSADSDLAARNLREEAGRRGLDPGRVIFGARLEPAEYLARLRVMDLFLDTLPYNAGTTASDALWAGLPVLTCLGESFAGRVAASILHAVGLSELITAGMQQYEDLAVRLAQTPVLLAEMKHRLATVGRTARLFDTPAFARNLESLYRRMYERHLAASPPEHLD